MSNIIAFAGAKQSGKTTSVNFLHGHEMKSNGFIKEFFIDEGGRLVVNAKYLDDNDKEFNWFWNTRTAESVNGEPLDDNFMFTHLLYNKDYNGKSVFFETFFPIL